MYMLLSVNPCHSGGMIQILLEMKIIYTKKKNPIEISDFFILITIFLKIVIQ